MKSSISTVASTLFNSKSTKAKQFLGTDAQALKVEQHITAHRVEEVEKADLRAEDTSVS